MMNFFSDHFERICDLSSFDAKPYQHKIRGDVTSDKSRRLLADCFGHHTQYHNPNCKNLSISIGKEDCFIDDQELSAFFINFLYKTPEIRDRDTDRLLDYEKDVLDALSLEPFSSIESPDEFTIGRNIVRYVVGDVGSGKSTFIRKIISDLDARKPIDNSNLYRNISVYIDTEQVLNMGEIPKEIDSDFYSHLFERMIRFSLGCLSDDEARELKLEARPYQGQPLLAIQMLIRDAKRLGYRYTIFIDNLDFYHYYYCRYSFFVRYRANQEVKARENITKLISFFTSQEYLGFSGLVVLISVRDTVWRNIIEPNDGINTIKKDRIGFKIVPPDEHDVIESRCKLFEIACDTVRTGAAGRHDKLVDFSRELFFLLSTVNGENNLAVTDSGLTPSRKTATATASVSLDSKGNRSSVVSTIYSLGQHGFRSLVEFFARLGISPSETELFERFFIKRKAILENLYINSGHIKYSQSQDHFPNMYLVDAQINSNENFKDAIVSHTHTYWLKYLIMSFVKARGRAVFSELLSLFTTGKNSFEENLVRLAVGSLCTPNEFRCLEICEDTINGSLDRQKLRLTMRGECLVRDQRPVQFCFGYRYLSSIVCDQWLSLPIDCAKDLYQPHIDFRHLYYNGNSYSREGSKFVSEKICAVIKFVTLLEVSWEIEIENYRAQFWGNAKEFIDPPNFKRIKEECLTSAKKILSAFQSELIMERRCASGFSLYDLMTKDSEMVLRLRNKFDKYYENPCPVA